MENTPVDYGRRLVPTLVDDISKSDPNKVFVSIPASSNLEDGYLDISYSNFAKAVNRCSWWLEEHLGKGHDSKPLFYIGPLDIRHLIVLLAAVKTGHVAFFSSHRNSLEAHLSLLEASKCNTILFPTGAPAVVNQILAAREMHVSPFPEEGYFMEVHDDVKEYPYNGTFSEMRDKTFVILHTSGSTGIPKPVFVTHGTFACNDAHQLIPDLGGKPTTVEYFKRKRLFLAFPLFHAANLTFTIGYSVYSGVICVLPPPGPLTADVVNAVHTYGNLDGSLLPPSIIIDLYNNPEYLINMTRKLEFAAYVGGTLPVEIGDPLSTQLRLITLMGSTETMLLPVELNDSPCDWQYIPVSTFLGHEFHLSRDGLRELVIVRNEKYDLLQGVFSTFPDIDHYGMKDLYEQHPTRSNAWVFRARADDIISFSNAEKLNPITMEGIISAHPAVRSAVIGGHGQFQAALLVEPRLYPSTAEKKEELLQEIWPTIVRANQDCPAHGRIVKDFVFFTTPDKPLSRAGKDTVQRFAALELYAQEFKDMYASNKKPQKSNVFVPKESTPPPTPLSSSPVEVKTNGVMNGVTNSPGDIDLSKLDQQIEAVLRRVLPDVLLHSLGTALGQMVSNLLLAGNDQSRSLDNLGSPDPVIFKHTEKFDGENVVNGGSHSPAQDLTSLRSSFLSILSRNSYLHGLSSTSNLFDCGLDSLQIPVVIEEVNDFLLKSKFQARPISAKVIYDNPTVEKLAVAVLKGGFEDKLAPAITVNGN